MSQCQEAGRHMHMLHLQVTQKCSGDKTAFKSMLVAASFADDLVASSS